MTLPLPTSALCLGNAGGERSPHGGAVSHLSGKGSGIKAVCGSWPTLLVILGKSLDLPLPQVQGGRDLPVGDGQDCPIGKPEGWGGGRR